MFMHDTNRQHQVVLLAGKLLVSTGGNTASNVRSCLSRCTAHAMLVFRVICTLGGASLFRGQCRLAAAEELDRGEATHAELLTQGAMRICIHLETRASLRADL